MRRKSSHRKILSPISLREVYAEIGEFTVKMVIDPDVSVKLDHVEVDVRNSDGKKMQFESNRWGTKLTINFKIDEFTPDGVAIIDVTMRGRAVAETRERMSFWVIK